MMRSKVEAKRKLTLNKETLRRLTDADLARVAGGDEPPPTTRIDCGGAGGGGGGGGGGGNGHSPG
jgi:hypothetical protein